MNASHCLPLLSRCCCQHVNSSDHQTSPWPLAYWQIQLGSPKNQSHNCLSQQKPLTAWCLIVSVNFDGLDDPLTRFDAPNGYVPIGRKASNKGANMRSMVIMCKC